MDLREQYNSNYLERKAIKDKKQEYTAKDFAKAFMAFVRLPDGRKLSSFGLTQSAKYLSYYRGFKTDFDATKHMLKLYEQGTSSEEWLEFVSSKGKRLSEKIKQNAGTVCNELASLGITFARLDNYKLEKSVKGSSRSNPQKRTREVKQLEQFFIDNNIEEKNRWIYNQTIAKQQCKEEKGF